MRRKKPGIFPIMGMSRWYFAKTFTLPVLAAALLVSSVPPHRINVTGRDSTRSLKEAYAPYFSIGVSVSTGNLGGDEGALIRKHFNSLTAENAMKMGHIHPEETHYNWQDADSISAFAVKNGMKLRGHTLVWHRQVPDWVFLDKSGSQVSREVLLKRLRDHITTVVKRYKGKVYAWDVVNEAISDNPREFLRVTPWLQIIGENYIALAFRWAHEADPDALLFYNDYNELDPVKREKIFRLVQKLKKEGVPVHGLGLQAHWSVQEFSPVQLETALKHFSHLNIPIQITELDVSIYPKRVNSHWPQVRLSPSLEQKQALAYRAAFRIFRKYSHHITGLTFWNLSDRHSWLDNFPVRGRKDYPLLFDQHLNPKQAYWEVVVGDD